MKTLFRTAAIAVASTALIAGGATAATAAPGDTASITTVKLKAGSTYFKTSNFIPGTVVASAPGSSSFYGIKATVTVNGKVVKTGATVYQNGIYFDRAWGAGTVRLINFTASGYDERPGNVGAYYDRPIPAPANSTRVRYAVESGSGIKVTKRGKKLTFKVTATYRDKSEKRKSAKKATIQVKKSGKWKTLKNVKLNSKGKATYKRKDGKKRQYRIVVKTTNTLQGANSKGLKI